MHIKLIVAFSTCILTIFLYACVPTDNTGTQESHKESPSAFSNEIESTFVINTNTGVFHSLSCTIVQHMNSDNIEYTKLEYDNLIEKGYIPCDKCISGPISETGIDSTDSGDIINYTPDKNANKIIASYNKNTPSSKITADQITYESTAGGYHTYIVKDGIKYEISYADGYYLQMGASNEGVSEEAFKQDMVAFLGALIGTTNAQQRINESVQSGDLVKQGFYTITCSGQSFHLSDDSWG